MKATCGLVLGILFAVGWGPGCAVRDASDPGLLVAPTVDEDPSLPSLAVNGTRLHVETHGSVDAPVIVLLHGGPGGDFRYMLGFADDTADGALVADHRLIFWDQRGSGLSRRHPREEISMELYQADLDALVDAVSPGRPVILVGHSWGGAYAASYLGRHPERVRGAVLIAPQALTHALYVAHGAAADAQFFAEWVSDPLWAREMVSAEDHARADFLLGSLELYSLPRFHNRELTKQFRPGSVVFKHLDYRWFDDNEYDFTAGVAAFPRPVWLLAGTADEVLGASFQARQVPLFGQATLVPLDGDGHNDPVDHSARRTIGVIRQYLDALKDVPQ